MSCLVFIVELMQAGFLSGAYGKIKSNQITGVIKIHCKGYDAIDDRCVSTTDDVITIEWKDDEFATITSQTYGKTWLFSKKRCRAEFSIDEMEYGNRYSITFTNRKDCTCRYGRAEWIGEYPYFSVYYQNKIYQFSILSAEAYNPKTLTWEKYVPSSDEAGDDKLLRKLKDIFGSLDTDFEWTLKDQLRIGEDENSAWY